MTVDAALAAAAAAARRCRQVHYYLPNALCLDDVYIPRQRRNEAAGAGQQQLPQCADDGSAGAPGSSGAASSMGAPNSLLLRGGGGDGSNGALALAGQGGGAVGRSGWAAEWDVSGFGGEEAALEETRGVSANFRAVHRAARALGGVPEMLSARDHAEHGPDERAVILYAAFLCSRLLECCKDDRAAHIIQQAWRRHVAGSAGAVAAERALRAPAQLLRCRHAAAGRALTACCCLLGAACRACRHGTRAPAALGGGGVAHTVLRARVAAAPPPARAAAAAPHSGAGAAVALAGSGGAGAGAGAAPELPGGAGEPLAACLHQRWQHKTSQRCCRWLHADCCPCWPVAAAPLAAGAGVPGAAARGGRTAHSGLLAWLRGTAAAWLDAPLPAALHGSKRCPQGGQVGAWTHVQALQP